MAIPVLQNNPVIGEMSVRSGAIISDGLARLGQQIGENLEKKAIMDEAQAAAPFLNATYRNAFQQFQNGNTDAGYTELIGAATQFAANPILSKLNDMALRAGTGMAAAYTDREIAKWRGSQSQSLTPEQVVSGVTTGTSQTPASRISPVNPPLPEDGVDLESEGRSLDQMASSGAPIVNDSDHTKGFVYPNSSASPNTGAPAARQEDPKAIISAPPEQRAKAKASAYNTEGVDESKFHKFDVAGMEDVFGGSEIGIPLESSESTSENRSGGTDGKFRFSVNKTTGKAEPSKEMVQVFDKITESAGVIKKSSAIQEAAKKAGGIDNLMRAPQRGGQDTYEITWPGNELQKDSKGQVIRGTGPIKVSKEELDALVAVESLKNNLAAKGGKIFGAKKKESGGNVKPPKQVVDALMANPNDPQARNAIIRMVGVDDAQGVIDVIIGKTK